MIIHSLNGGGAEHSVAMLANAWAAAGNAVTIITLDTPDTDIYPLDAQVQRISLHACNILRMSFRRFGITFGDCAACARRSEPRAEIMSLASRRK